MEPSYRWWKKSGQQAGTCNPIFYLQNFATSWHGTECRILSSNSGIQKRMSQRSFVILKVDIGKDTWVFPKIGGKTPKWMVNIMVPNPMNKWMICGVLPLVLETPLNINWVVPVPSYSDHKLHPVFCGGIPFRFNYWRQSKDGILWGNPYVTRIWYSYMIYIYIQCRTSWQHKHGNQNGWILNSDFWFQEGD